MHLFSQKPSQSASIVATIQAPLNKQQTAFNSLVKKIEAKRKRLAEWEAAIAMFRRRFVADLLPLQDKETDLQVRLAQALDLAHAQPGVTKGEKRKLTGLIVDLAQVVLQRTEHEEMGSSGESVDGFRSRQGIRASMIGAYRCAFGE